MTDGQTFTIPELLSRLKTKIVYIKYLCRDLYKLMSLLRPYGSSKRNFDELDGSRFGYLKKKRNFDQLDSAGFGSFGRHF